MFSRFLTVLSVLTFAATAQAAGWQDSFPPAAANSQLEPMTKSVVVLGAGEPADDAKAAAHALATALRAAGKVQVVDGASISQYLQEDDAAIVVKAGALEIDTVLIVRVFLADGGLPPTAVVTTYDREGKMLLAFTTTRGKPVEARAVEAAGAVLPTEAIKAVSEARSKAKESEGRSANDVSKPKEERKLTPQQMYDEKHLSFPKRKSGRFKEAYIGQDQLVLRGTAFYRQIGRDDLVQSYFTRSKVRSWFVGLGVTASIVGGIMAPAAWLARDCVRRPADPIDTRCLQYDSADKFIVPGLVTLGAGTLMWIIGAALPEHPINANTARRLGHDYNQKLRKELNLESLPPYEDPDAPAEPAPEESSAPAVSLQVFPGGLGIGIQGSL